MNLAQAAEYVLRAAGHPLTSMDIASTIMSWEQAPVDQDRINFIASVIEMAAGEGEQWILTRILVTPPEGWDGSDHALQRSVLEIDSESDTGSDE